MPFKWNPKQYEHFSDARMRPALDLLVQVHSDNPKFIYDLGCGTGSITQLIQDKWPYARVVGIDNSETMLNQAKQRSSAIEWANADLLNWEPKPDQLGDIVFSNASLQWLENHATLFPKLAQYVSKAGIFAVQMPRNYDSPSHQCLIEVASQKRWKDQLLPLLRYGKKEDPNHQNSPVLDPAFYYETLSPYFKKINIWETTYLQVLEGENPVLEWMKGTGLRPILTMLETNDNFSGIQAFIKAYSELLLKCYPKDKNGKTLFPFKRLFIIGIK